MLTFEIINSSIIEFDIVIEVPANHVIEQINVVNELPEGLTYARTSGAKIRLLGTSTWLEEVIVDNSTDVQFKEDSSSIPSQINLILTGLVANPTADSQFELRIPAFVYDKSKLISKEVTNKVSMSSDFENYIFEEIPLQFFDANLNLYASLNSHRADDFPIEDSLKFCFQMLNSLSETDWYYEITIPITEDLTFNYPFNIYLHKPYLPLKFATDFTIRLNLNKQVYILKIPHQNQYKGQTIFIEIPYTINTSSTNTYPYFIQHECSLELFNSIQNSQLPITYTCYQIKLLSPLPRLKFTTISLK